ncbi:ferritin-like domain-containing protein [Hymenobacter sp. BT664]|uniref:Ferritin-like domain-containing protein n=1 Tax=Hymenobacter montanus TaxID=2771359 RepID=A0A927BC93_9BACT|nr:ferritin-like domain-containing protein [Hymenobacter montanus]MBD2767353.1 ferritin-like domain-containing protein [Hymenobacter montanus]
MTFTDVKTYFLGNRAPAVNLSWYELYRLSPAEMRAVRSSLQTFQRGEGTGGDHLSALAARWNEPGYAAAMRLFVQEEEGHAALLGRFMDQQGIPRLETHWLHEVFRSLGRPLGLEHMVRVMLTAEVVATVYYRALHQATFSGLLRQICHRILHDEEMHLVFHSLAIRQWEQGRSRVRAWLGRQFYRGLLAGTALVVYAVSRHTFRAGGYGLGRFVRAIVAEYTRVEQMQQPQGSLAPRVVPDHIGQLLPSKRSLFYLQTLKHRVL